MDQAVKDKAQNKNSVGAKNNFKLKRFANIEPKINFRIAKHQEPRSSNKEGQVMEPEDQEILPEIFGQSNTAMGNYRNSQTSKFANGSQDPQSENKATDQHLQTLWTNFRKLEK